VLILFFIGSIFISDLFFRGDCTGYNYHHHDCWQFGKSQRQNYCGKRYGHGLRRTSRRRRVWLISSRSRIITQRSTPSRRQRNFSTHHFWSPRRIITSVSHNTYSLNPRRLYVAFLKGRAYLTARYLRVTHFHLYQHFLSSSC
jgi:hypothetical protein